MSNNKQTTPVVVKQSTGVAINTENVSPELINYLTQNFDHDEDDCFGVIGTEQELNGWDENVKAFVKEKQMTKEVQEEFLTEYDSHLFRGGINDVEWFYNELYGGNK
jgi:hypothetical protein